MIVHRALRYPLIVGLTLLTVAVFHYFTDRHAEHERGEHQVKLGDDPHRDAIAHEWQRAIIGRT
ncbi:MAG: hypothetical protein A3G24_01420 [Betaproteobacteria bacterium RIFCSPLOWO2_12_FULL_62_13]|nr:MAG: hypothetical protein A3G24_01420 [Betaproteobacteria bacterium RIFCSPLOWO2_12_FULL_62_13]